MTGKPNTPKCVYLNLYNLCNICPQSCLEAMKLTLKKAANSPSVSNEWTSMQRPVVRYKTWPYRSKFCFTQIVIEKAEKAEKVDNCYYNKSAPII